MNLKRIVDFIADNYWGLAAIYCFAMLIMWVHGIPDDGSNLVTEKNIGTIALIETILLCMIMHVWYKISKVKEQISELQDHLERLEGLNEAAEQDTPTMEEHL